MKNKTLKETFKKFFIKNENGWEYSWSRDVGEGFIDAIQFSNDRLDQMIRLEEKKDYYHITIEVEGKEVSTVNFDSFDEAKKYVKDYIKNTGQEKESLQEKIKSLKEKDSKEKDDDFFVDATDEYLRVLNIVMSNGNASEDIQKMAKKVKDFIKKNARY